MKVAMEKVRFKDSDIDYEFAMGLPETLEEAVEVYGEENALWLLNSGLKVKLQNAAREAFRQGKGKEEAEEAARAYRPGNTARQGSKARALELLTERAGDIKEDPDLKEQVFAAFSASKFKEVVELLEG